MNMHTWVEHIIYPAKYTDFDLLQQLIPANMIFVFWTIHENYSEISGIHKTLIGSKNIDKIQNVFLIKHTFLHLTQNLDKKEQTNS